jgi:putative OPT family oligopeptide transporter
MVHGAGFKQRGRALPERPGPPAPLDASPNAWFLRRFSTRAEPGAPSMSTPAPLPQPPVQPGTPLAEEHSPGDGAPHEGGLPQLTDEQVHTWSLEQKDRWWLENVYQGDMPQLTLRSALTGMVLGGVLSLTNLYVGAKTGWTLGVGITSVILAFAMFKALAATGLGKEMTVLENNAMQSIATAAGYMTGPLVSSVGAYIMVTNQVIPTGVLVAWLVSLSILGVLFAFPLKKRFINEEQMPFPEGRAAGVVMHSLHTGDAKAGLFKAKLLLSTGGLSALVTLFKSEAIMTRLKLSFLHIPEYLDGWIYKLATPSIMGTPLKNMTIRADTDLVMVAAGGLMGIRTGVSLLVGACINYFVLVPWMIQRGDITGKVVDGVTIYGLKDITFWSLWGGVAMMTTASLFSFFAKPQVIISAFKLLGSKGDKKVDVLKDIELPMKIFVVGIPVFGAIAVALGATFFGVQPLLGLFAIPFVFVLTLIAVTSTGLTSITPVGALGKLTQLTFAGLAPGNVTTNLMTAGITSEVSSNAANLLMDIKPGYMLGAKPRQQAVGHVLGILAGAVVAVPVFYAVFLHNGPQSLISDQYPFPGVIQWKAVAEVLTKGLSNLKPSAQLAALVGAVVGIVLELVKMASKGRFPITAVGLGLAFVLAFNNSLAMASGAILFWAADKWIRAPGLLKEVFVRNQEPTCAGIIAGGALMGIAVTLIEIFVLGG